MAAAGVGMALALAQGLAHNLAPSTPEQHEKNLRADIEAFTKVGRQIGLRK